MSTPTPHHLRSLYRSLIRELPSRTLSVRTPLHNRIRSSFTSTASSSTSASASTIATQAAQYITYLRAQRKYLELLERYNPGMDMDEEERVRLTARRVGMELPKEFVR